MGRAFTFRRAITASQKAFFSTLLFSIALAGCGNSCFLLVSNPGGGGGTISGSAPNCSLNQTNGDVNLRITSSLTLPAGAGANRIQHVFVTIRGIEANPSAIADENSPDWQELAPKLVPQPVQLDLLGRSGDSCESRTSEHVTVPAGEYRQIRLRLSPNQPDTSDPVLPENWCGSVSFNCVVTSDGDIRPLILDSEFSQIKVPSERITGGFFRILPETTVNLKIEFNPESSQFIPLDDVVRLVPVFTVELQTPCDSTGSADR